MIVSGDDVQRMLEGTAQTKVSCRSCGEAFTFEQGVLGAGQRGINEKVVMCPKCNSVYEVKVTPGEVTLLADVTSRYASQLQAGSKRTKWWRLRK